MHEVKCPFCGREHWLGTTGVDGEGNVADYVVLSVECVCGATFAKTRGGRPNARSD